ncbi:hypothetical protein PYV02_07915 [Leifsonia sp. H3M29-4]|uniref:hypothetical protein n=1 Tax=Salinibacterium metalliresistens TaxID=3031321 RepID=UPI0023DA2471|nr:hypothetical protein [Salinibacterium metalliresistens]MDF1479011.1 hypothetical protein [Salinibacterium metalliresistens]
MTIAVIVAIAATLALVIVALVTNRQWFVLPAVAVVAVVIVLSLALPFRAEGAWLSIAVAIGLAGLGVLGGSPIVGLVLRFAQGGVELGDHGGIVVDDSRTTRKEILRGGATIGILERLALIGAVVAGQAAAIAIIVAVKGLGRFSELDDSQARERFIIGTLTSLIWAGACAAAIMLAA